MSGSDTSIAMSYIRKKEARMKEIRTRETTD